jgi:ABC-type multidrug transport system permease subunit
MGLATVVLAAVWRWGGISGWWVLLGALTTIVYAWGVRPRKSTP